LNNEIFLINDSGELDVDRVILFGTENNIELLSKMKNWYCDGTFAVSPKL
jgi:hypothetical protein